MASGMYNAAITDCLTGVVDLNTDTLKIMLVDSTYTFDPDETAVTTAAASEITATNYTAGYGGAGRKTATVTVTTNDTDNRADVIVDDLTWTSLGGATNDTIRFAILIKEITDDAGSKPIACWQLTSDVTTNGGDFTLDFAAAGNIHVG